MSTWSEAEARSRAELEDDDDEEAFVAPPVSGDRPALIIVDHFDIAMVDVGTRGARLLVRSISRLEALALVRGHRAGLEVMAIYERGQSLIERELGLEAAPRPKLCYGTRLLVVTAVKWNEIKFALVEYEADGDGCIP